MPSTSIRKTEYDLDRRILSVWFVASGKRYEFEDVPPETFAEFRGPVVAAGLAGGVLRALSRHRYKIREMVASPICGAQAAAYLTLPVVHYFRATGLPIPATDDDTTTLAAAFLIGVSAMWISDILFEFVVRKFRPEAQE
ncbi:MAG: KTSC domain-containing protein [Mesorhizobium sp.]|nr:MAG: KTSC domain-containing protein [Mesorhizobium sp.]